MNENVKEVNNLLKPSLSCFGGEDGGVGFVKLRCFLESMIERSNEGDEAAGEILKVVERFNKLIEVSTR